MKIIIQLLFLLLLLLLLLLLSSLLLLLFHFIIIIIIIIIIRLRALQLVAPAYSGRADNNLLPKFSLSLTHWYLQWCFFFSIQVPVSKSLLSPIKLFFVHVLLTSQSKLLQYTSQSELILHLMHLQLLGLQSLPSCPTFLYFPFVHQFISRYGNIYDLTFLLGFLSKNNIWLSSFNLGITLDCKIPQNLVPFVLNNSIWLMLVPVLCSLEFMFFV